jgi:hypothetical protein
VSVHAKSRLTLEPLRTLRSETKGQDGACPDRTRAIPCKVWAVTAEVSIIWNWGIHVSGATSVAERYESWSWVQLAQIGPSQGRPLSWVLRLNEYLGSGICAK